MICENPAVTPSQTMWVCHDQPWASISQSAALNNNPMNVWIYFIERSFENVQHGSSSLGASPSLAKANRRIWEDRDVLAFGLQQPFKTVNNYTKEPKQGYCLSDWRRGRRGRSSAGRRGRNWQGQLVTDRQPKLDTRFGRKKNLTCLHSTKFPAVNIRGRDLQPKRDMKTRDVPVSCKSPIFHFHAASHFVVDWS